MQGPPIQTDEYLHALHKIIYEALCLLGKSLVRRHLVFTKGALVKEAGQNDDCAPAWSHRRFSTHRSIASRH